MAERVWCEFKRDAEIRTPRLCVRCNTVTDDTTEVGIRGYAWTSAFGFYGKGNTRRFPACPACARAMRARQIVAVAVQALALLVGVAATIAFIPSGSPKWHVWAAIGGGFVAVQIIAAIALLPFPIAVKLESTSNGLRVDFWNSKFGNMFRIMNEGITIDDQPRVGVQSATDARKPVAAVESKPGQPRRVPIRELVPDAAARDRVLHDFAHRFLPGLAAEGAPAFSLVLTDQASPRDFVVSRWVLMERRRARASGTEPTLGLPAELDGAMVRIGGRPALLVTLPPPEKNAHAYFVAIVLDDPGSAEPTTPMTITLERTDADPSGATGVLCQWRNSQHINSGGRVKVSKESFLRACEKWLAMQPA